MGALQSVMDIKMESIVLSLLLSTTAIGAQAKSVPCIDGCRTHGHSLTARRAFENPPDSTRLQFWYHWNGDCVTREGIARDFAALGKLGVSQVYIIAPQMAKLPVTAPTMSDEWLRLFEFAIAEAKRNGFTLGFHNCPGWSSSGGPWIRPENAMKVVVSSECDVTAGEEAMVALPQPMTNNGFYRDIATYALPLESPVFQICDSPVRLPLREEGSEHVIVAESREPLSPTCAKLVFRQTNFHADGTIEASADGRCWKRIGEFSFRFFKVPALPKLVRLTDAEDVRFFRVTFRHAPPLPWVPAADLDLLRFEVNSLPMIADIERYNGIAKEPSRHVVPPMPGSRIVSEDVVDLTSRVAADGRLSLVGAGLKAGLAYRIVRIGYTSKGVGPAPSSTGGLECDKLSRSGIEAHWAGMPARILALKGAGGTVTETFIDSYEVGGQNWSECLPDEFARRCGYPIGSNLLTVCGYCLKDVETATRFLWDYKRTISELFAENYYDRFAELCCAAGIRSCAQTYGGPFDGLRAARHIDRPQGEFWMHGEDCGGSVRRMASAVHLYGKGIVSAESFTSEEKEGRWLASPHAFRMVGDRYGWLAGANQLVAHSYCHQPFTNTVPGISLGRHGSHFTVNSTWWKEGPAWHDYVRRGQALLQYGKPGANLLVLSTCVQDALTDAGYEYDLASESDLDCLAVRNGRIGVPGKSAYAALVVAPDVEDRLTPAARERLEALSAAGARVLRGRALETVRKAGFVPSFIEPTGALRGIHRVGGEKEVVWFVVNVGTNDFAGSVELASAPGLVPERYDAKTGEIATLPFVGRTQGRCTVELALCPGESAFIVLSPGKKPDVPQPAREVGRMDLSPGWTIVRFKGLNAPSAPLQMPSLTDWTASSDEKLAWFSGRALYERDVDLPAEWATDTPCRELVLDLGSVYEIANVFVDGCAIGCLWEHPYRMRIPVERIRRRFRLGVEVVNLLPNRLIGDARARACGCAEEKGPCGVPKWVLEGKRDSGTGIYTWSNFRHGWCATDRPLSSGLLGPVRLENRIRRSLDD